MCVCLSISNSRFNYCKQQNHCLYPKRTSVLRTTREIKRVIFFFFIVHHNSLELSFPPFCPLFHIILICHHFWTRRMSRPVRPFARHVRYFRVPFSFNCSPSFLIQPRKTTSPTLVCENCKCLAISASWTRKKRHANIKFADKSTISHLCYSIAFQGIISITIALISETVTRHCIVSYPIHNCL